jgi:hypothetical protein
MAAGHWPGRQTAFFRVGEALKRMVLPALILTFSPVRGLSPGRAFVLTTRKVPKLGRVNPPSFFSSHTIAAMTSPATRVAAVPLSSALSCRTEAMKAFDIETSSLDQTAVPDHTDS